VKGLDSCPIALATVAAIKTFRENQTNIQKRNRKRKGKEVPYWPGTNQQESN